MLWVEICGRNIYRVFICQNQDVQDDFLTSRRVLVNMILILLDHHLMQTQDLRNRHIPRVRQISRICLFT